MLLKTRGDEQVQVSRRQNVAGLIIPIALGALFLLNLAGSLAVVMHCYADFPVHDMWRMIIDYSSYTAGKFSIFLSPHGDHRILFPELLYAIDALVFHAQQYFLIAMAYLLQFGAAFIIWRAFHSAGRPAKAVSISAAFLISAVLFYRGIGITFVWPILIGWQLQILCSLLAIYALRTASINSKVVPFCAAIALGWIATFSIGGGMVIWPVLILLAILVRLSSGRIVTLVVSGAFAIFLYTRGLGGNTGPLFNLARHPLYTAGWICEYLGMPIAATNTLLGGVLGGLTILALIVILAIRRKHIIGSAGLVLYSFCAVVILTALLTAAGRIGFGDPVFLSARQSRYLSFPLAYWAAFTAVVLWFALTLRRGQILALTVLGLFGCGFAVMFSHLHTWERFEESFFERSRASALALEAGVFDSATVKIGLFVAPEVIRDGVPYLRDRRLALFATSESHWVGKPAASLFHLNASSVGELEEVRAIPFGNGYRVTALVRHLPAHFKSPFSRPKFVFTGHNGGIIGLGMLIAGDYPATLVPGATVRSPVLIGFLLPESSDCTVHLYVESSGHNLSPVSGRICIRPPLPPHV